MSKRRNWSDIIARFEANKNKKQTIKMGSPGSAQVTRCRLLADYEVSFDVDTTGNKLVFSK